MQASMYKTRFICFILFSRTTTEQQGPLLLTWYNFNPNMDKCLYPLYIVGWNYLSIPKLHRYNRWSLEMNK